MKQTLRLAEDKSITTAQFRVPGPRGMFALLYGRTAQNLNSTRYDLKNRKNDNNIKLSESDLKGCGTLFYFVIVSDLKLQEKVNSNLNVMGLYFANFSIFILSGFFPLPPPSGVSLIDYFTSVPRFSRVDNPGYIDVDVNSWSAQEIVRFSECFIPMLHRGVVERIRREILQSDGANVQNNLAKLESLSTPTFSKSPYKR